MGRVYPFRRAGAGRPGRKRLEAVIVGASLAVVLAILKPADIGLAFAQTEAGPARPAPSAVALSGVARVIDGDTLRIGETRVRLHAVDAFESDQVCDGPDGPWSCGRAATEALQARIGGRTVSCEVRDIDRYGRSVSRCEHAGVDPARELVEAGLALAYRRFGSDYVAAEEAARARGAGAWAGSFDRPEQWRRRR